MAENTQKQTDGQCVEMLSGSEILVRSLMDSGVDTIFGYPGGSVIGLFDILYKTNEINHILVRHEQAATHAADGYARVTGKPGVVIVTSGPGATNTVTGIATAYMDSIPMVVITGQVPSALIGNDAFQEADIIGITRPITKHSYLVNNPDDIAQTVAEAFHIASTGKPGPVLIDFPKDVLVGKAEYNCHNNVQIRGYNPTFKGHGKQINKAADLINSAKKPLFYVGGGVILSNASEELRAVVKKTNIPVITTLMGLGAFPEDNPLSLGMVGMHGTYTANMAMMECDVLVSVGARFDDRVTGKVDEFSPNSQKIHIDIDPGNISKNIPVKVPIVGDAKGILQRLLEKVNEAKCPDWQQQVNAWKKEHPLHFNQGKDVIVPQYVIEQVSKVTKGEAIVVTDVGQNQMWAAQFYEYRNPRSLLSSGGLGTMGYGFPAAIGAQFGDPEKTVVCFTGDGGFQMNIQELATAVWKKLPIKIILLNNGFLGMVRQWQELFFDKHYAGTILDEANPDFMKIAEAYGAVGKRIDKPEEVTSALEEAMQINDKPVVLEFIVSREENVFPMVPAGAPLNKMFEAGEGE